MRVEIGPEIVPGPFSARQPLQGQAPLRGDILGSIDDSRNPLLRNATLGRAAKGVTQFDLAAAMHGGVRQGLLVGWDDSRRHAPLDTTIVVFLQQPILWGRRTTPVVRIVVWIQ